MFKHGLRIARKLLSDINDLGVPSAGEFFRYDHTICCDL